MGVGAEDFGEKEDCEVLVKSDDAETSSFSISIFLSEGDRSGIRGAAAGAGLSWFVPPAKVA